MYAKQIKEYFKKNWVAMLFGAIPTALVAFVSLINIFVAFRVDYELLRDTVSADTNQTKTLNQQLTIIENKQNINISKLLQAHQDEEQQINEIQGQVNAIFNKVILNQ